MRNTVEPTITFDGLHGAERQTHPAFGFIRASRISGNTNLYDSDFNHQHFIRVTIGRSAKERKLSNDWLYDSQELIEIDMSESQWGHFVSAMNAQSTPCTLTRGPMPNSGYRPEMIPDLPSPKPVTEKFDKELMATLEKAQDQLKTIASLLTNAEKPMSKKEQAELARTLSNVRQNIGVNVSFVADQFSEHVEKTVEKAKVEFNAFKMNHTLQIGANAITNDVLQLPTLAR